MDDDDSQENCSIAFKARKVEWSAPELDGDYDYDTFSEVYGVGCLQYNVLMQKKLIDEKDRPLKINWGLAPLPKDCKTVLAQHLVRMMMAELPGDRSSFSELLEHPYFWDWPKYLEFLTTVNDTIRAELNHYNGDYTYCALRREFERGKAAFLPKTRTGAIDWTISLNPSLRSHLGQPLTNTNCTGSLCDLIHNIRNRFLHRGDDMLIEENKAAMVIIGTIPNAYIKFWLNTYPHLFLHTYKRAAQQLITHDSFKYYFQGTSGFYENMIKCNV